jgi:hypothetical protein
MIHLDESSWRVIVVVAFALAALHAWTKLSRLFALTWFGAGVEYAWFALGRQATLEALVLPAFVIYLAAALTKGLVERGRFRGNHLLHVVATGVFSGLVVLPLASAAMGMGWPGTHELGGAAPSGPWIGGVPAGLVVRWVVTGGLFYGTYKLLDHAGLGRLLQVPALAVSMVFLPRLTQMVADAIG